MTKEEALEVRKGDSIKIHQLQTIVDGLDKNGDDWFFRTEYGDFNIEICERVI